METKPNLDALVEAIETLLRPHFKDIRFTLTITEANRRYDPQAYVISTNLDKHDYQLMMRESVIQFARRAAT